MRIVSIGVAGLIIEIQAHFFRTQKACLPFAVDGQPDFSAQCTMEDFDEAAAAYENEYHCEAPSDVSLEMAAMLDVVSNKTIDYDVILIHGAVIDVFGEAFLFTGKSGIGKTTHIKKWVEYCPDCKVVNGDKPFIKINKNGTPPLACGSPWAGKENMYTKTMVPLKSIIIMERSEENNLQPISFSEAFPTLLQQVYRPRDEKKMRKTLHLMQRLSADVSFWRFRCNNFKNDCFDVAYSALVRNH